MKFICKYCGKEFNNKPSSNAKYCSKECMKKDPNHRLAISNGVKNAGFLNSEKQKLTQKKMTEAAKLARIKKYGKYEDRLVKTATGQELNITNGELDKYRKTHLVCEICGKVERVSTNKKTISRLAADHDHKTGKFRGLLCCDCNRKLGWYEKLKDKINNYLEKMTL